MNRIRNMLARRDDVAAYSASNLRTLAVLGLAASLLFAALTVVALGTDDDDTRVLGATATEPTGEFEVASTEGGAFFVYAADPRDNVAGSATVIVRGEGSVSLTVGGVVEGDRAVISASVENGTEAAIAFAGGLTVAVDISVDGLPWRTVEPSDRAITQLGPGETATVSTEVALDGYGQYDLTGEVLFSRR